GSEHGVHLRGTGDQVTRDDLFAWCRAAFTALGPGYCWCIDHFAALVRALLCHRCCWKWHVSGGRRTSPHLPAGPDSVRRAIVVRAQRGPYLADTQLFNCISTYFHGVNFL